MMKHNLWFFLAAGILSTHAAFSAKIYHVTGTVTHLDTKTVILNSNGETYEFDRNSKEVKLPSNLSQGDSITVEYSMNAKNVSEPRKGQAAGTAAPGTIAPDQSTSPEDVKKGTIQDDRVFYGA